MTVLPSMKYFLFMFFFVTVDNYFQILQQPHSTITHLVQTYQVNFFKAVFWHFHSSALGCLGLPSAGALGTPIPSPLCCNLSVSWTLSCFFLVSSFIWWEMTPGGFPRKNIGEVKCLSICMSENIFVFPERLRNTLGKEFLKKNFQRLANLHCHLKISLISLISFLCSYVTCFSLKNQDFCSWCSEVLQQCVWWFHSFPFRDSCPILNVINFFPSFGAYLLSWNSLGVTTLVSLLSLYNGQEKNFTFLHSFIHSFLHRSHNAKCLHARHTLNAPYKTAVCWLNNRHNSIHTHIWSNKSCVEFPACLWCLCLDRHFPGQYWNCL